MGKRRRRGKHSGPPTAEEEQEYANTPKSFVVSHGKVTHMVVALVQDLRQVMRPHTAVKLQERRANVLKDYIAVAGPLSVTHLVTASEGTRGPILRFSRLPQGPTLSYRVEKFSLMADLRKRPGSSELSLTSDLYIQSPVVVLNGFRPSEKSTAAAEDPEVVEMASAMFGGMFPSIGVDTKLSERCKRVLLLSRDRATGVLEFRHYMTQRRRTDASPAVQQLLAVASDVTGRRTGNVRSLDEVVTRKRPSPESNDFGLPKPKYALSVCEIGPRLTLRPLGFKDTVC